MIINKITPYIDLNYWLKSLEILNLDSMHQNLYQVPKVFDSTNKITLSTSEI